MLKLKKLFITLTVLLSLPLVNTCHHQHDESCNYDKTTNTCNHIHNEECQNFITPQFKDDGERG